MNFFFAAAAVVVVAVTAMPPDDLSKGESEYQVILLNIRFPLAIKKWDFRF